AALVLARRCHRFSERLSTFITPLVSPVDDSKHVWSHYSRISKVLKGCRRHSYFGLRTGVEVKRNAVMPWWITTTQHQDSTQAVSALQ
ncbi:MAG: hypothetical protein AAGD25_31600, partial [Cyanobacteria bacterium P01_F01_bin.150]